MTEQDWLDVGRPLDVPFTIIREVYYRHYEEPICAGISAINLAVEQYRGDYNALYLEVCNVGELYITDQGNPMYLARSVAYRHILRAGATVVIQRGDIDARD